MKPLIFKKVDIIEALDKGEVIQAVEKSFVQFSSGKAVMPTPQDIVLPHGETHVKSAYVQGGDLYCIKVASGFYDNPKRGLSSSQGMMILLDVKTGVPQCVLLEEGILTDYRTAAAGAVAAQYLAKKSSSRVLVVGTGIQARLQVEFLSTLFTIQQLWVWGRSEDKVREYCDLWPNASSIGRIEDARDMDIIVTTTPSRHPILSQVEKGVHINAIGSDMPGKHELNEAILSDVKVVTDSTNQCAKSGELQHAIQKGKMTLDRVHGELGEIIAREKEGRTHPDEITVFDSTGLGVQDLAIAEYVFRKMA